MTLADEGNRLRLEILRLGEATSRRYPPEIRGRILDWVERAMSGGLSRTESSDVLGVPMQRLAAWRADPPPTPKALVPVEVREETATSVRALSFVAPSGHRIEGLSISEAVALLRAFS
jgi:hypothetical protein